MLKFDKEQHQYTWNGAPKPSVTQVQNIVATRKCADDQWVSVGGGEFFGSDDTAARFGRAFHDVVAYRLQGIKCTYDSALELWLDQYESWRKKRQEWFADSKKLYVIDWKTSTSRQKKWRYQTAGYAELVKCNYASKGNVFLVEVPMYHPIHQYAGTPDLVVGNPAAREYHRVTVRFDCDKYDEEIRYNKREDWNVFLSILNVYRSIQ